jgi:cell division protein FtsI/penicillin-binding protein 2
MNWRYTGVLAGFLFLFVCVTGRLFYWQTVRAQELSSLGESQYGYRLQLNPTRGEIKTSDGFAIAANKISYLVFANPKEIGNVDTTSTLLADSLQIDKASISALLNLDKFWVALDPQIDEAKKEQVEKLNIPGVGFEQQNIRFYPEASIAAKILGFVGKNSDGDDTGYFGLEGYYDRQLKGKSGVAIQVHDALGRPILAKMNDMSDAVDGRSLTLHIDRSIQFFMEDELSKGVQQYGADSGMAAVIDPKTGGVLAMAAFPTFDPRDYREYSNDLYRNPFITDTYEPGSTFKPLVMGAAIDKNLVKPDTPCPICDKPVEIGGYKIQTWNNEYTPNESMTDVIVHSDNTGMVYTSQLLGLDTMLKYFDKFGIGQSAGIDLQGELAAPLRERDSWYPIDVATASFGQGISVTPISLLTAFTAVANEGKRMEPHIVKSIETPEGDVIDIPPKVLDQPISAQTAKVVTEMMVQAVDRGESKWTKLDGYRIAGKTGTAQIPIAGHYDPTQTIASFVGFAPADNPKFLMLVIINRPTSSIYGAETAAPVFFKIADRILKYYGIPPTEPLDTKK